MLDRVVTALKNPGWQLVLGGVVLALAFPSRLAGSLGLAIVAGGIGVGVMRVWPRIPEWVRSPGEASTTAFVISLVVALGLSTFWDTLTTSPDWQQWDWGPQRAVLARIMSSLPGLDVPTWNHAVGTGDAPLELYPQLAYLVTGHVALIAGLEDDVSHALMVVAVIVHLGIAAATTLLAMRLAGKPLAFIVGVLAVIDSGAVAHGGSVGLFRWGLLHSAMSLMFGLVAALGVVAALRKPRLRASIAIWIGTALACATHPAGLIGAAASAVALGAVAVLASDVPPRRALAAIGHLTIGVAIGAIVWMPLAERILAYGQHFPNPVRTPARLLEDLLAVASPTTSYAMLTYAGYLGILAGLWSRRAIVVYVSTVALLLLVGLCDAPYLAFDLAPGQGIARLGTERLAQLARPFVAAIGAYAIAMLARQAIAGWRDASPRRKLVAAALIGVLAGAFLRVVPAFWRSASTRAYNETQVVAADARGREELVRWARARVGELRPDAYARALFEVETHEHFHLTAETGLPTLHLGPQPDLLLRERIEDLTPDSLRRFDIKWIVGVDGKSPTFGDPESEFQIGTFRIRTVKEWDGKFARIERGTGEVTVTRLDDEAVEIDVKSEGPVLVALGTGFYPRWRARHASGIEEPVYAHRSTPTSNLSVVSAWVGPGKTTFTVDGSLPSDGRGRLIAVLGTLFAIGGIVAWRIPRVRIRVLRRLARAKQRLPSAARVATFGVPITLVVLLLRGCTDAGGPVLALELGSGIRGNVSVEARTGGHEWQQCSYTRLQGAYICDGLLVAYDGITALLNDAIPSWGFNTPGVLASADIPDVEMRVRFRERLHGTYWTATNGDNVILQVSGEPQRVIDRTIIVYGDEGKRSVELTARIPTTWWQFTFVREETILPPRPFLAKPPEAPPPAINAIR